MKKRIELLGVEIDNYSVRESIMLAENYLNDSALNTIVTITMKSLQYFHNNEEHLETVNDYNMTLVGEKEILQAANIVSPQRIREVRDQEFFTEFLKRCIRGQKKIFLLGQGRDEVDKLLHMLEERYPKLVIVSNAALDEVIGDNAAVINQINSEVIDVVLSILPTPQQEEFLKENKSRINAKVWYGLGDGVELQQEWLVVRMIKAIFNRYVLKKKIEQYDKRDS